MIRGYVRTDKRGITRPPALENERGGSPFYYDCQRNDGPPNRGSHNAILFGRALSGGTYLVEESMTSTCSPVIRHLFATNFSLLKILWMAVLWTIEMCAFRFGQFR